MRQMSLIRFITGCLFTASLIFSSRYAYADDQAYQQMQLGNALEQLSSGRVWDNKGDIDEAATHYMTAVGYLTSAYPKADYESLQIGGETIDGLTRRVLYIDQQLLRNPSQAKRSSSAILSQVKDLYRRLETMEPTNPSWPYMDACLLSSIGNYYAAYPRLQKSISLASSDGELKARALKLSQHIKPAYDQQQKWEEEEWKKWLKYLESERAYDNIPLHDVFHIREYSSHTDQSPQNNSVPDYERRARDAEYNNDYGAADRFRSGGNTCSDDAKYW